MISALIQGDLIADPKSRTTTAGKPFMTATIRVPAGAESILIYLTAFSESVQAALGRLKSGDSLAASGVMELNIWQDRENHEHRDWRLTAHQIMSVYEMSKRRKAAVDKGELA